MNDHDTVSPEIDEEIRARLQALAQEVKERTDTEAALERMPRRSRPPTVRLLAVAACFILAVAIAAVVMPERQSVDTVTPAQSPTTTECPDPIQPRAITSGGQMKHRFAAPVASAATALVLLAACGDDGPTTLAKGEGVDFVGTQSLGGETMDINAEEEDGKVTGEVRFNQIETRFECADTDTDDLVILGGEVTEPSGDGSPAVGERMAVIIREGDPDSVTVWFELPLREGEVAAGSCDEFLESIPEEALADDGFADVEAGDDIETG